MGEKYTMSEDMVANRPCDDRSSPARERDLIERAQRGCAASSHELIALHQDRLFAFVWRMVRNTHEAEEVCQETFLRAFSALGSFNNAYRFSTWLFTIGYRLCLNGIRKRRDVTPDLDFGNVSSADAGRDVEDVADRVANSDEARRLKERIWNSVDQLTPQQRAAVLLFYRESLSCQEIGEVLEMPAATVKSHLHRARSRLKDMLADSMAEDWSVLRFEAS
jgi:RNA polymerase sigma-70 factor, ECF subfamily